MQFSKSVTFYFSLFEFTQYYMYYVGFLKKIIKTERKKLKE